MRHSHMCASASHAGFSLMSGPPRESTLSQSPPIILKQSLTPNVPIWASLDIRSHYNVK